MREIDQKPLVTGPCTNPTSSSLLEISAVPLTTSVSDRHSIVGAMCFVLCGACVMQTAVSARSLTSEDEKRKRGRRSPCGLPGSSEPGSRRDFGGTTFRKLTGIAETLF